MFAYIFATEWLQKNRPLKGGDKTQSLSFHYMKTALPNRRTNSKTQKIKNHDHSKRDHYFQRPGQEKTIC